MEKIVEMIFGSRRERLQFAWQDGQNDRSLPEDLRNHPTYRHRALKSAYLRGLRKA